METVMETQLSEEIGRRFRVYFPRYVLQPCTSELVVKYPFAANRQSKKARVAQM